MNFKEVISHLASTVTLVNLCNKLGIDINKTGNSVQAICQFHDDSHPSMVLYDNNSTGGSQYHCFSCNAHGNIFDLVKEKQSVTFKEAVIWLAKEYGVSISPISIRKPEKVSDIYDQVVNNVYGYALQVYVTKQDNTILNDYLSKRGYDHRIADQANLCVKNSANILVDHLSNLDLVDTEKLYIFALYEEAGLIKKSKTEKKTQNLYLPFKPYYYDHFRSERLLFPIHDHTGELKGFSGRSILENYKGPKYLFTKGLKKTSILYRSHYAFSRIRKSRKTKKPITLYICEGLFDALRLESLGLYAVAILGADLSANQSKIICDFAKELHKKEKILEVCLFFDNDSAGVTATSNAIMRLFKDSDAGDLDLNVIHLPSDGKIDPDSYLKNIEPENAKKEIEKIYFPAPVLFLAHHIGTEANAIRDEKYWNNLPYSLRYRASVAWHKIFENTTRDPVLFLKSIPSPVSNEAWYKYIKTFNNTDKPRVKGKSLDFIDENSARIGLARQLAASSSSSGFFPKDIAEWRRLAMCSIALEAIIEDRFNALAEDLKPFEPLNTIKISRKLGGDECRVMSLHCAEDLISHQYIMNELLTERHDGWLNKTEDVIFSEHIPVTRFYNESSISITTGEGKDGSLNEEILSFAYQIDMDVVEGRVKSKTSGMFRPYFDCWRDFTFAINHAATQMDKVHMVRLDLKRYYDRLKRYVVQDELRNCLNFINDETFVDSFGDNTDFIPLFKQKKRNKDSLINWLLEQCFGYEHYDPKTGESIRTDDHIGIPQGPDLSAFLANMVLFKVDNAARKILQECKEPNTERYTAWYARYVDDMVLIAEDSTTLSKLRVAVEDAVKKLDLELVAKEQPLPMSPDQFQDYLTQGKALSASGPVGHVQLFEIDEIKYEEKIERFQSLGLLNDNQLYSQKAEVIIKKINIAANGKDLRHNDLPKVAKWLWYAAALQPADKFSDHSISIINFYIKQWGIVSNHLNPSINPQMCPWEDPLMFALDGLYAAIETYDWLEDELTEEQIILKSKTTQRLINHINNHQLIECLSQNDDIEIKSLPGWGVSNIELTRTYWQKRICLKWLASKLGKTTNTFVNPKCPNPNTSFIDGIDEKLKKSLLRLRFIEAEVNKEKKLSLPEIKEESTLFQVCILVQQIYIHLGAKISESCEDPLVELSDLIKSLTTKYGQNSKSICLLKLLLKDEDRRDVLKDITDSNIVIKAFKFLCTVTNRDSLMSVLAPRKSLFLSDDNEHLIPPLPSYNETTIYGFKAKNSYFTKIEALIKVTIKDDNEDDNLYISSKETTSIINWTKSKEEKILKIHRADNKELESAQNIFLNPPKQTQLITSQTLKWVAVSYRALVKSITTNYKLPGNKKKWERVPAWPNVVMELLPPVNKDDKIQDNNTICILSSPVDTSFLNQAFIRDGSRGLRPLSIPLHNGHLWRAGVVLTDLLGFTRKLDKYADIDEDHDNVAIRPVEKLLRNSLRKLNGSSFLARSLRSVSGYDLPLTIERTLRFLENFPEDSKGFKVYEYGFLSQMENSLMRNRLKGTLNPDSKGELPWLYAHAVQDMIKKIPVSWFEQLEIKTNLTSTPGYHLRQTLGGCDNEKPNT